jgi:CBS domain-containing protein
VINPFARKALTPFNHERIAMTKSNPPTGSSFAALVRGGTLAARKIVAFLLGPEKKSEADSLAAHTVGEMMTTEVKTVPMWLPLWRLFDTMYSPNRDSKHQGYPVVDDAGHLTGMVTCSDMPEIELRHELGWLVAADVMSSGYPEVAYPDESLWTAAERMQLAGVGRLPVISRDGQGRVIGILTRSDVFKVFARGYRRAA